MDVKHSHFGGSSMLGGLQGGGGLAGDSLDPNDVALTVSLHCFLLSLGARRTWHPQCLCTASCCYWGTSHPQCLCTASCCYWGDIAPTVSLHCFLLSLGGCGTHSVSALLLVVIGGHPPTVSLHCFLLLLGDVAPTVSLHCFLLFLCSS